jgi:preprotein translocase subunit SecE
MSISKWVNAIFIAIALLSFIVFDKTLKLIFDNVDALTDIAFGNYVSVTTLVALALAGVFTFLLYKRPDTFDYLSDVVVEMRKVTWPSWGETKRSTIIVIVFTIVLSLYLAVFDQVWKYLTDFIITGGA